MQNLGDEAVSKRPRVQHELADLYRSLAEQTGLQGSMLIVNQGMYLPSIQRFVKFATCDEKTRLKQLVAKKHVNDKTVIDGARVADFYHAIWHANMQRPVNKDEGIILLLIEPINNPFKEGDEFTWAGLITEFTCFVNNHFHGMLSRCSGLAPYLFKLVAENSTDRMTAYESNKALPYYFRVIMNITKGHISTSLTKFHCNTNAVCLAMILKAMAFRLEPKSIKSHFLLKDTFDIYRDEGVFNYKFLISCLTSNQIIAELAEVKPLPIGMKLPEKAPEVKPPVQSVVNKTNFFPPVVPKVIIFKQFDSQIITAIMKITENNKTSAMYLLAQYLSSGNDLPENARELPSIKRAIIQLRNWNDFIKRTKIPQWQELLSQAINSLTYGALPVEYENTLTTFYQDLSALPDNQHLKRLLAQIYWVIINCDQQEQLNLELSTVNNLKCQMEFGSDSVDDFCLIKDLWLLFRGVKDQQERQKYLGIVFSINELFTNQMSLLNNLAL